MVEVFERFMEKYKAERNPAENTVKSLKGIIPKFLGYCKGIGRNELNEITPEDVIGHLNSLEGTRTSTKKIHKAFITLFMNFCFSCGFLGRRLGRVAYKGVADVPRAPLKGFTESEMSLMKQKAQKLGIRERIIFHLISNRPLRISELVKRRSMRLIWKIKHLQYTGARTLPQGCSPYPKRPSRTWRSSLRTDQKRSLFSASGIG